MKLFEVALVENFRPMMDPYLPGYTVLMQLAR
jgi:hypothetical protein